MYLLGFNVNHALLFMCKGRTYQHDLRGITGELLHILCNDVETEPSLQPLTGKRFKKSVNTENEARLDVSKQGFWKRGLCRRANF